MIGWGTGVTAGELAALSTTREVVAAEISSAVLAADPFFASANLAAGKSPKLRLIRSDAYRALLRSEGRFDVIASEPSNPWMAGVEMLFSREFLLAARSRLTPGGAYVQWFHCYESDDVTLELVLRTFRSVFPETAVWYTAGDDLLLVGFSEPPEPDLTALAERMARPDLAAGLARAGIDGPVELIAHELMPPGVLNVLALHGPLHTLLHPRLTYLAARAFFAGGRSRLPFSGAGAAGALGAERSLARQLARARGRRALGPDLRDAGGRGVQHTGRRVHRLARGLAAHPPRLAAPRRAPRALAHDGARRAGPGGRACASSSRCSRAACPRAWWSSPRPSARPRSSSATTSTASPSTDTRCSRSGAAVAHRPTPTRASAGSAGRASGSRPRDDHRGLRPCAITESAPIARKSGWRAAARPASTVA